MTDGGMAGSRTARRSGGDRINGQPEDLPVTTYKRAAYEAIRDMIVRGAPAIGVSAAFGVALAAQRGDDVDAAAA